LLFLNRFYFIFVESDLIVSLSKIADRIGHSSNLNVSNTSKKHPLTTIKKKQHQQPPKLQSSISLIVGDSHKNHKRTSEESRSLSNSNSISNNYDLTNKRHKRIGNLLLFRIVIYRISSILKKEVLQIITEF
jgi:hypothetical protein